jgi:hypothetical protein
MKKTIYINFIQGEVLQMIRYQQDGKYVTPIQVQNILLIIILKRRHLMIQEQLLNTNVASIGNYHNFDFCVM